MSVVHSMLQRATESQASRGLITSADSHDFKHLLGHPLVPYAGLEDLRMPSGSELRRSLEVAAREEMRHRALVASLREPVITTSLDGRITGFNAAAVALLGEPTVLYSQPIHTILPFVEAPDECAVPSNPWQGHITTCDGRRVDLEVSLTLLGPGGSLTSAAYVVHDVSHHAELNRMREQLLYSVAHELGGPLSILTTTLDLLQHEGASLTTEESAALLHTARGTALRLKRLMDDLLTAGSIRAGRFQVALRPTPLQAVMSEAIEAVLPHTARREQQVRVHAPRKSLLVHADARYLRQVLVNLLTNASKYSPDGTTIEVHATVPRRGQVAVEVADQGPGIPPELQSGLFDHFHRLEQHAGQPGTGLGLGIARGIVEAHGGRLELASEPGKGTRVSFTLRSTGR